MESDDSTESSPHHYARGNRLSIDSRLDPFSLVLQINASIPQPTSDVEPSGLTTDASLPRLHLPAAGFQEQLEVPEGFTNSLARTIQYDDIDFSAQYQMPLARYEAYKRLAELKVELPALASDPDHDCRELSSAIRKQRQPNFRRETIPLERRSVTNDEGLVFPDSVCQFRRKIDQRVYHEKLDVPKEAINHLVHALQDDWPDGGNRRFLEEVMPRPILVHNLAVTPPLSSYAEDEEDSIPDMDVCEVPVASDPGSMIGDDLKAAESAALQKERGMDLTQTLDVDTLWPSPLLHPLDLFVHQSKISSIRLESPISPMDFPFQDTSNGTDIPALLKSIDMDHALPDSVSSRAGGSQTDSKDNILELGLETVMAKSAAAVMRGIEQEHISIEDAVARVEVPVLDFSIPDPEWHSLPMEASAHLKWLYESQSIQMPPCPRHSQAESKLRWLPFLQNIDPRALTKEAWDCERDTSKSINSVDVEEVPTSADYARKRPGFAVLREPESDECLEIMLPINAMPDLESLAKKRRLENNAAEVEISSSSGSDSSIDLVAPSLHKRQTHLLPGIESNSTISTLLSTYIDLRTAKRRKQDKSLYFTSTSKPQVESRSSSIREPSRSGGVPSDTVERPQKKTTPQAPCPGLNIPKARTKLIKGLNLSRNLFFGLEELYPNAKIIERDFDRWNTVAGGQGSVSSPALVSSLAAEADVIVSPATGIIVTTLLKVIQKPPPGYGGQSSIRDRISCVSLRYERLIVLVSEANAVDETGRDLTPPETIAYAEFVGFTTGLGCKVEVLYVGGGEVTLLKWLVSSAARHAAEATESQEHLIEDETQWELFLRRAGFNAYAAQAILGCLKLNSHNADGESEIAKPGLLAFMTMTDVERLQRFRGLMGGESVLDRVNKTLMTKWR